MSNINWYGVFQSIKDTWLPLLALIIAIILIAIVIHIIRKKKK